MVGGLFCHLSVKWCVNVLKVFSEYKMQKEYEFSMILFQLRGLKMYLELCVCFVPVPLTEAQRRTDQREESGEAGSSTTSPVRHDFTHTSVIVV